MEIPFTDILQLGAMAVLAWYGYVLLDRQRKDTDKQWNLLVENYRADQKRANDALERFIAVAASLQQAIESLAYERTRIRSTSRDGSTPHEGG